MLGFLPSTKLEVLSLKKNPSLALSPQICTRLGKGEQPALHAHSGKKKRASIDRNQAYVCAPSTPQR